MSSACDGDDAMTGVSRWVPTPRERWRRYFRSPPPSSLKRAGSSASRGEDAPKPDEVTACLATRLHNFPGPKRHFFIVPPGEVASPLFFVRGARGSHALLACSA